MRFLNLQYCTRSDVQVPFTSIQFTQTTKAMEIATPAFFPSSTKTKCTIVVQKLTAYTASIGAPQQAIRQGQTVGALSDGERNEQLSK